jgi:hypothetical protein
MHQDGMLVLAIKKGAIFISAYSVAVAIALGCRHPGGPANASPAPIQAAASVTSTTASTGEQPLLPGGVEELTLLNALATPGSAADRAIIIDEVGRRHVWKAIPGLIPYLDDGRALIGSDNWVGGHAGNALRAITGKDLPYTRAAWQAWWSRQPHDASGGK